MKKSIIDNLRSLTRQRVFYVALLFLASGMILNELSARYLEYKYGESLPILPDVLLDNLPYFRLAFFYDLFAIIPIIIFVIYAIKKKPEKIPYFMVAFAILNILRAIFIILTPFGEPNWGEIGIFDNYGNTAGVYPSGHTGSSVLTVLLSSGIYRTINIFVSIGIIFLLLLGRGHYSIDIFSAVLFALTVYLFCDRYLKKIFVIKKL